MDLSKIYSPYQTCLITLQVNVSLFGTILTNKFYVMGGRRQIEQNTKTSVSDNKVKFLFYNNLMIW